MPRTPKTPQEKKQLELKKDHFTFAKNPHAFRKGWREKKAEANRQYRRKSDELLAVAKPEISADDVDALVGDVTVAHLEESVSLKRLYKWSTVSLSEKIKIKSQKRQDTVGRRVERKRKSDQVTISAVSTLVALEGDELVQVVNRIARLLRGGDPVEWMRLCHSRNPLDRAIFFVEQIERGAWTFRETLQRDQNLCKAFKSWVSKANRILAKQERPAQRKLLQKIATEKKVKTLLRQNRRSKRGLA